jgi:hypothetical protein
VNPLGNECTNAFEPIRESVATCRDDLIDA